MINKLGILFFLCVIYSCRKSVSTSANKQNYQEVFSDLLQESVDQSLGNVPGISMSVHSPLLEKPWSGAVGFSDKESNLPLDASQVFRIASVSKTFVAAAILRLHEMDSLSIEDPIADHIDNDIIALLETDGYEAEKIRIKHCLNHTSGLFDYAVGSDDYVNTLISNPNRRWTRLDQIKAAMQWGDKLGEPGKQTQYSDTGYIILGAIIEKFYAGNLAQGLRKLLKFDTLGLLSTWLETLEDHPFDDQVMVRRYYGRYETTDWDASIDLYGGGGLVSTTDDLAKFFHALFNNKIYAQEKTLILMLSFPEFLAENVHNDNREIEQYNYGMWTVKAFGENVHIHTGFWGTSMLYIPAYDASIAINTTRGKADRLIKKTILALEDLKANQ